MALQVVLVKDLLVGQFASGYTTVNGFAYSFHMTNIWIDIPTFSIEGDPSVPLSLFICLLIGWLVVGWFLCLLVAFFCFALLYCLCARCILFDARFTFAFSRRKFFKFLDFFFFVLFYFFFSLRSSQVQSFGKVLIFHPRNTRSPVGAEASAFHDLLCLLLSYSYLILIFIFSFLLLYSNRGLKHDASGYVKYLDEDAGVNGQKVYVFSVFFQSFGPFPPFFVLHRTKLHSCHAVSSLWMQMRNGDGYCKASRNVGQKLAANGRDGGIDDHLYRGKPLSSALCNRHRNWREGQLCCAR